MAGLILVFAAAGAIAAGADEETASEPKHTHIRLGGLIVGAGYASGPACYNGWHPRHGIYDPFWYSPTLHSGFHSGFLQQPNMGQVKLDTVAKDASVYVDGAYAGSAQKLKSFWLAPGVYNLELRDDSQRPFNSECTF